jgi:predicted Zn-dependent protease
MGHHRYQHDNHDYHGGHDGHIPPEIDQAVRNFIRQHKKGLKVALLVAAVLVVLLIVGAVWGLVWGAGYLKNYVAGKSVPAIPMQWEQTVGDAAFAQLRAQTRFVTDPAVLEPLNRLAQPLLSNLPDKSRKYSLHVSDSAEVNACALPGGYVVFNRGLLQRARTADEVQGVLAHEIAHIQQRHSLVQLAQNIGLNVAIGQLSGGESQYADALVKDGAKLLTLKFSRDHERAADDVSWELLQKAGINPGGMVDFFASLKADTSEGAGLAAGLLSTHPTPQERIDRLRQKQQTLGPEAGEFRSFQADFVALGTALRGPPSAAGL